MRKPDYVRYEFFKSPQVKRFVYWLNQQPNNIEIYRSKGVSKTHTRILLDLTPDNIAYHVEITNGHDRGITETDDYYKTIYYPSQIQTMLAKLEAYRLIRPERSNNMPGYHKKKRKKK